MSKLTMQDVYEIGSHIVSTVDYDVWKDTYLNNVEDSDLDLEVTNLIKTSLESFGITIDDVEEILRDSE